MMQQIYSFPPLLAQKPKVLILGTIPGEASLRLNQYYGFERNAFWKIMRSIYQSKTDNMNYSEKRALIEKNGLCLWDVLKYCRREGSLDTAIQEEHPNDIPALITKYPTLNKVIFNGKKAAYFYKKYFGVPLIPFEIAPSTSPAYASMSIDEKLQQWTRLLNS